MKFNPLTTAAFTGHRSYRNQAADELDRTVERLAREGCTDFLCGMAVGFDMAAAESVMRMRTLLTDRKLRLIAVVPFAGQAARFAAAQRERYGRILAAADVVVCLAERYTAGCYRLRNDFLVDNASAVVAWYDGSPEGGTHYTVTRARRAGRRIINLRPCSQLELDF